jgi:3-ketosteroid 9alpha-monooxygenase subunit A
MKGWFQVAFERDVVDDLTPVCIDSRRLVLVRRGGRIRAFDADCPHRGAHLGYGGRLCENAIICPFHGYRIGLGQHDRERLWISEYAVSSIAGMVFVCLSRECDNGWIHYLQDLDQEHFIINGFEIYVRTPMETVIENAFDHRHFTAVHRVRTDADE